MILPAITLSSEQRSKLESVIAQIDLLPTQEEITQKASYYDTLGDDEGYNAYMTALTKQVTETFDEYANLPDELQEQVENVQKLMDLEAIWSVQTMDIKGTLTVYQINKYSQATTTLVQGGSVQTKLGSGMSYTYWDVIVVEKNSSGKLYVSQYVTADGSKLNYAATTSDGFVLLLYQTSVNASVGDEVTVSFTYKNTTGAYKSSGYGTVTFGTESPPKPEKDNTSKLSVVQGADTNDLIEVNLYDYDTSINTLYNSNNKYPGYQQDNGTTSVGSTYSKYGFNFGNNITSDLAAGHTSVTNQGGTINTTTDGANSPISGAISTKLGSDGKPALADGTSLGYLFSNSSYAKKQNKNSINGLFQYDASTASYYFNSRENHAQFNSENDTFTLYEQIITSNFMMYPFGNFLPFNDIVHQSAQVTSIDKAYLQTVAQNAIYKYNNGAGSEYNTLGTQLNNFVSLMDKNYSSWNSIDCMNQYFKTAGINRTFSADEDLVQKIYSIDYDEPTDFYFGMEMKMNFRFPKNGLTGADGKQPMVFYFTGDDDVWIYVDDILFLDLTGIHRHVGGEIDFTNGVVKYYSLDVDTGEVSDTPYKTVKFSELVDSQYLNEKGTFKDYSSHSFSFYYMERGAGSGVCRMNFNLPPIRKNSISVTKELSVEGRDAELLGNPDFSFQVLSENGDELFIGANTEYDLLNSAGVKIGTGITDENGVFKIKAEQTAVFNDIPEDAGKYFVRELLDVGAYEQYATIIIDGNSKTTDNNVTVGSDTFVGADSSVKDVSDGSTSFHFNNSVDLKKVGSISISKSLKEYNPSKTLRSFNFNVTLDGNPVPVGTEYTVGQEIRTVTQEGIITISADETAVLTGIVAGSIFTVRETSDSAEGYVVGYVKDGQLLTEDYAEGMILSATTVEILVKNSEKGVDFVIPIEKILEEADEKDYTCVIELERVTAFDDMTPYEPSLVKTLPITVSKETVQASFEVGISQATLGSLPQKMYFRITEQQSDEYENMIYDESVYVVEVTVSNDSEYVNADITGVWKDGIKLDDGDDLIRFTNRLIHYELPQTGSTGTTVYSVGGSLIVFAAILGLYIKLKRRREDVSSP